MNGTFAHFKEFRILYLASPALVESVQRQLEKDPFSKAQIHFYTDSFELVRDLAVFGADLVILDERAGPHETHSSVSFENLSKDLKFAPHPFHYTMRRVIVVLPLSAHKTSRAFQLGLANVRGVIVDPESAHELFFHALAQLYEFSQSHSKTSLCISGGGLEGYLYSLGVGSALENCFLKKSCSSFDVFCGVSSGAILAGSYAANVTSQELVTQAYQKNKNLESMKLSTIFDPATGEVLKRTVDFARAFSTWDVAVAISRLQNAVPLGLFRGEKLKKFFENHLKRLGIEDHFSALEKELYISATDQDTGENVVFGEEPWRDIKISQAIRASTALPPFYLPEKINGHWFTDGQLTGSADFNIAISKGAGLVVYIDPMVAYTSNSPGSTMKRGGYFTAIQAVKSLVQSRSTSLLKHSMDRNPDVDFIVFHPTDDVMEAMAGNPMKYKIRTELIDLGFNCTVSQILNSYDSMAHKFAKHGFVLKPHEDILDLKKVLM